MDVYTQEVLWASTRGMRGGVAGGTGGNGNGNSSGSEGRTGGKGGEAHDEDDEDSEEEDTEEEFLYLASFGGSMGEGFRQAAATVRKKKLAAQAVQHANQQAEAQKRVLDYVKNQASRSDPGYESSEHEGSEFACLRTLKYICVDAPVPCHWHLNGPCSCFRRFSVSSANLENHRYLSFPSSDSKNMKDHIHFTQAPKVILRVGKLFAVVPRLHPLQRVAYSLTRIEIDDDR
ncbi:hypothetical protein C8R46DRAFT_404154 [Mycena filopes]|nr:hypothetical protein C8R46DRAFT_404154 [Mycena filopes]